ncbi:MAG: hypothetical protein Q4F40_01175 [Akkermansia sp.]|nr:hypothetical protein [Akkermansia sp.]
MTTTSDSQREIASKQRILVLGNGVNRVAGRNKDLAPQYIKENYCEVENGEEKLSDLFMDRCMEIKPSFVHRFLASLQPHIAYYCTTNYDYAMEDALSVGKNSPIVHHIHGKANNKEQCIYSPEQYKKAVDYLKSIEISIDSEEDRWFELMLNHEVHICGLALQQNEKLLYYILHYRRQQLLQRADFNIDSSIKPIYAWLTYTPEEKAQTLQLAEYLRGLSVRPVLIPVYENDFVAAWERITGRMSIMFSGIHISHDESSRLVQTARPQGKTVKRNCSYSSVPDFKYPERCFIKILNSTLAEKSDKKNWCFYCELPEGLYLWYLPLQELLQLTAEGRADEYIRLYLNFTNGSLYFAPYGSTAPARLITTCIQLPDIESFEQILTEAQN